MPDQTKVMATLEATQAAHAAALTALKASHSEDSQAKLVEACRDTTPLHFAFNLNLPLHSLKPDSAGQS